MIQIIPSILTSDSGELEELLKKAEEAVDRVHIDIIDGVFADNKTIDPLTLREINTKLKLDFHLMVKEPVNWIEKCANAGADRIIAQTGMMSDQVKFVGKVQEMGAQIGLAIDLDTPVSSLDPVILNNLDIVLVMSVPAGFGGQKFREEVIKKIKRLSELREERELNFKIQVDGGITLEKIDDVRREGVNEVVIGRRLFKGSIRDNIDKFRRAAYKQGK